MLQADTVKQADTNRETVIQLFHTTAADVELLGKIDGLGVLPSALAGYDFSHTAVVKPWGYEYLVYECDDKTVCAWVLHMKNNGVGTSLHCHRAKQTRIVVLEGEIEVKTIDQTLTLSQHEEAFFQRGAFHAIRGISDPCVVVEIESPSDKIDAVRWTDHWGRERQQYESQCELVDASTLRCTYKTTPALQQRIADMAVQTEDRFD